MSIEKFNKDLLRSMLEECSASLKRSLSQHLLLSNQHKDANARFQRAQRQGSRSDAYRLSMRLTCISGMMTMYEEHMNRKAARLQRLKLCLRKLELKQDPKTNNSSSDHHIKAKEENTAANHGQEEVTPNTATKLPDNQINIDKQAFRTEKNNVHKTLPTSPTGSGPIATQSESASTNEGKRDNSTGKKVDVKQTGAKRSHLAAHSFNLMADEANPQELCMEQSNQNKELVTSVIHSPKKRKLTHSLP